MQIKQDKPISEVAIKQIALISIIIILAGLICYNLSMFIPSLLGAITLYIISRKYLLYLIEEKKWKPSLAAIVIIVATLFILILPVYLIIDVLIDKLGNAQAYMEKFNVFVDKIHDFVFKEIGIDLLSKENINKLKDTAGKLSTSLLNTTFNALTVIASMYFVLYFMLISPRKFERLLENAAPFKKIQQLLIRREDPQNGDCKCYRDSCRCTGTGNSRSYWLYYLWSPQSGIIVCTHICDLHDSYCRSCNCICTYLHIYDRRRTNRSRNRTGNILSGCCWTY